MHLPWKQLAVVNFVSPEECAFCFRMVKRLAGARGCPIADLREGMHTGLHENLAYFCAKCSQKSVYDTLPMVWMNNQEVAVDYATRMLVSEELLQRFVAELPGQKQRLRPSMMNTKGQGMKAHKSNKVNKIPSSYSSEMAGESSVPYFFDDSVQIRGSAVVINL